MFHAPHPLAASAPGDFDFLFGSWQVSHRRLKRRLAQCTEWDSFPGRCTAWPLMGRFGNVDDNIVELPGGPYRAATVRAYDPGTRLWRIWWLDGRQPDRLDVPVVGRFENGVGTFTAEDTFEGRPIVVRFLWTMEAPDRPHWAQAFSDDAGATWETNWVMDFARV
jgi:hypothetical protein